MYVIETGHPKVRCQWWGHKYFGCTGQVANEGQLPKVVWCARCTWRQISTDVPEAYKVVA